MMEVLVKEVPDIPVIRGGDDLPLIIAKALGRIGLQEDDIVCVASKIVSRAENRDVKLNDIEVSETARTIQNLIPRKDPRIIQLMIDETGDPEGGRLDITGNHYVAGWLPNGLRLTSAGIDTLDPETVALLPVDPDQSARQIGRRVLELTGVRVGVIITDSEGREDKKGSTQIAIGTYGVPALRVVNGAEETLCDMLAGAAAIIVGQRGVNKPVALIRGVGYSFTDDSRIEDALYKENGL